MLLLVSSVHAFCGYYAGDDGQAITNASSIEVLTEARDDPVDGVLDDGSCAPPGDDRPGDDVVFDDGANWEDGWE